MFFHPLYLFMVYAVIQASHVGHSASIEKCVYTFNVPQTDNKCPPGSTDSDSRMENLKEAMENQHSHISEQIQNLTRIISELVESGVGGANDREDKKPDLRSGTHYTRWGHSGCPDTADLLYTGFAGKSFYTHGGGVDYQCLPEDPFFPENAASGHQSQSYIYGVEYERHNSPVVPNDSHDDDVPCAVCHVSSRGENIMIPAKVSCPTGWTKEYDGFLMSQHYTQKGSTYICVDKEYETVSGGHENKNGGLLYVVEVVCGSLSCPPYENGFELACVVCTL